MAPTNTNPQPLIDVAALPAVLAPAQIRSRVVQVCDTSLRELATAGEIESILVGRKRLFTTASIVAWLERRRSATKQPKVNLIAKRNRAKNRRRPTQPLTQATTA